MNRSGPHISARGQVVRGLVLACSVVWISIALPAENLALGKSATATSSLNASVGPSLAVDGDYANYWQANDITASLTVDLGQPYPIGIVRLFGLGGSPTAQGELLVGLQTTDMTAVTNFPAFSGASVTVQVNRTIRYLKYNAHGGAGFPVLGELEAFAAGAETLQWELATGAAPWPGMFGSAAGVFHGRLWLLGGGGDTWATNGIWWTTDGMQWTAVPQSGDRWSPRMFHRCVVHDRQLWIVGGSNRGSPDATRAFYNDVWSSYDGTNWQQRLENGHASWPPRMLFGLSALGGTLVLYGGLVANAGAGVWSSTDGLEWQSLTSNPGWSPRYGFGDAVLDGRIWLLGGSDGNNNLNDVFSSSNGTTWTSVSQPRPWSERRFMPVVSHDGAMWLLGGYNTDLSNVWSSTNGITWRPVVATGWGARWHHAAAGYKRRLWVIGGDSQDVRGLTDVWRSWVIDDPSKDSDGDGLKDVVEDGDGDGEIAGDLNFNRTLDAGEIWTETDAADALGDADGDGMLDKDEDADLDGKIAGDLNNNRKLDPGETWLESDPLHADVDGDSMEDRWELRHGLNPADPLDAGLPSAEPRLTNLQKYRFGLNPAVADTDGDGLGDYDELYGHGSDPLVQDTEGDGMPDGWEVTYGLNPRSDDAGQDLDLDGVSNLIEYQQRDAGYRVDAAASFGEDLSDYERLFGTQTNRFYYDKGNRLIGADYNRGANGLSIAYLYDDNGNIIRQRFLDRDANTNGLPDLWEFLQRLTNNTPPTADTDGDGWTDAQEWKAGSLAGDPLSQPNLPGAPGGLVQSAPRTQVLPLPNTGQGMATVAVRVWDGEGNLVLPELQCSTNAMLTWWDGTLVGWDGTALSPGSALPNGTTHELNWNAGADLGPAYTNTLWLRARARDVSLIGPWSAPVAYNVEISLGNPVAANDTAATTEDNLVEIAVLANDSVANGQTLTIESVSPAAHGSVMATPSQTILYTPEADFAGEDGFTYTVTDGLGGTSTASVRVVVTAANDPPGVPAYRFATLEDQPLGLRWNPARDAEGNTVRLVAAGPSSQAGGAVEVQEGVLTYRPAPDFNGTDTFGYTVEDDGQTDGTNDFRRATGMITVEVGPVNDPPVLAVPGPLRVDEDTVLTLGDTNAIRISDVDAGPGQLECSLSAVRGALWLADTNGLTMVLGTNGGRALAFTATLAEANRGVSNLVYRPEPDYQGSDVLTVSVNDRGNSGQGGPGFDARAVLLNVAPVNDVPQIVLIQPADGAVFIAPATITLEATAADPDGRVVKVEFFAGLTKVGEVASEPYRMVWDPVPGGTFEITAVATDDLGATNSTDPVLVTSKEPGFVRLEPPEPPVAGAFTLRITGDIGQVYGIEVSVDLETWLPLGSVTNLTGTIEFRDPAPPEPGGRFYRAVLSP